MDLPRFASLAAAEKKLLGAVDVGTKRFDEHPTAEHDDRDDEGA